MTRWEHPSRLATSLLASAILGLALAGCSRAAGAQLTYAGGSVEGAYSLFQVESDGADVGPVFQGLPDLGQTLIWAPDGDSAIVYNRADGNYYLAQPEGGAYGDCLTCGLDPFGPPAFSPEGDRIAVPARDGLFLRATGAPGLTPLSTVPRPGYVAWSPEGDSLAFASVGGDFEIYRLDLATGLLASLTDAIDGDSTAPAWSPQGDRLAFHTLDSDGLHLMTIASDGSGLGRVVDWRLDEEIVDPGLLSPPQWSPDGEWIAFAGSSALGDLDIFVVHPDGTELTNLTNYPGRDDDPVWSPDGRLIAFRSNRDGNADIYWMAADGSNVTDLTRSAGTDECCPAWRP